MKGSTLHRAGLTREKMGVLANLTQAENKSTRFQLAQYYKASKSEELNMLWNDAQRGIQRVRNAARASVQKSPAAYLLIGFIAGVLFMGFVILLVSLFSISPRTSELNSKTSKIEVIKENETTEVDTPIAEQKYIVKKGDTLNGIAYRFYGKYSESKINEIQRINNIKNPAALSINQELIIPISQDEL